MRPEVLRRLVDSDALVILFDPVTELNQDDCNFDYLDNFISRLRTEAERSGRMIRGHLPQRVAMCMTKFDDPSVFQPAYADGFVSIRDDGAPRVPDERTVEFFGWMEDRIHQVRPDREGLREFRELLQTYFLSISYFVTSSIGLYRPTGRRFDPSDSRNVSHVGPDRHIRGDVKPLNVLEPLIALERSVRGNA